MVYKKALLRPGTEVVTVKSDNPSTDWTADAQAKRTFGIPGIVIGHHDSHGLCYEVAHFRSGAEEGASFIAAYDPDELVVRDKEPKFRIEV